MGEESKPQMESDDWAAGVRNYVPAWVLPKVAIIVTRYPMLDHPAEAFPGVIAHGGLMADEQLTSAIGGLLPIALCGRTSL